MTRNSGDRVWQPIGAFGPGYGGSMPKTQHQVVIIETNGEGDLRQRVLDIDDIPRETTA